MQRCETAAGIYAHHAGRADLSIADPAGCTVLHMAASVEKGSLTVFKCAVDNNGDPNLFNKAGATCLHLAVSATTGSMANAAEMALHVIACGRANLVS